MKFVLWIPKFFSGEQKKSLFLEKGQSLNDALHHENILPKNIFIIFRVRRIRSSENFHKHRRVFELPPEVPSYVPQLKRAKRPERTQRRFSRIKAEKSFISYFIFKLYIFYILFFFAWLFFFVLVLLLRPLLKLILFSWRSYGGNSNTLRCLWNLSELRIRRTRINISKLREQLQ